MQADNEQGRSDERSLGATYASRLLGVETYEIERGRVVAVAGELDASTCSSLTEYLVGPPGGLIVVDLSGLTFIDSSGLGLLHEAWRRAIADEGSLIVCRPCAMVERVLEITGLDIWIQDWNPRWSNRPSTESMDDCHSALTQDITVLH
jgi:anti-anti-sigma factor